MLGIMRKYQQSPVIKVVFVVIVLSFIGTIFLVWGEGGQTSKGSYAIKLDATTISFEDYQQSYYRLKGMYEQINGRSLTPEMEKQLGIKKAAIEGLVETALITKEARRMGIKVSKDEIKAAIQAIPSFQRNGAFDFQLYQETLRSNRMTPSKFEEAQEQDLLIQKTRKQIQDKAKVTDEEALQAFSKNNDKINLHFVAFSPADVKSEVKLTEQDLTAYLQNHQEQFKTPEQISVAYGILDPSGIIAKQEVTDAEAQTYYQKNIDRYQGKGGILPYAEVQDRVKADTRTVKGLRQAYEMAADAVNKNKSGDINAAAAALGVKVFETQMFTANAPASQLAGEQDVIKRAFALKEGELGGPVETKKGIYVLKLKSRKPAAVPPLEQIRAQVEQGAREAKAKELAKQKAEQAMADLAKGATPAKAQETGSFSYNPAGDIPKMGKDQATMETAFSLTSAAPVPKNPFQIGDRWYAFKLKDRQELNKEAFEGEKEKIKQNLLPKKQQDALDAWLKDLKAKVKIEINPSLLAE